MNFFSGQVPTAEQLRVPTCKLQQTVGQSVPDASSTLLEVDITLWDNDGMADLAGNQIIIQRPGIYLVTVATRWSPGTGNRQALFINVDGATVAGDSSAAAAGTNGFMVHAEVQADAGDAITGLLFQGSGAAINTSPSWLQPFLAATFQSDL